MNTIRLNTITKTRKLFQSIFRRNNSIFFSGLGDRIDFLSIVIGDLQDVVRKGRNPVVIKIALARVVSFSFCVADNFPSLWIADAMSLKYPLSCGYCHHKPCTCDPKERLAHTARRVDPAQLLWTIRDWQAHLNSLYGGINESKGLDYSIPRLFKGVCELYELKAGITHVQSSAEEIELAYALEITDIIAWTMAIANLLKIDLEDAIMETYGAGCPTCKQLACRCRRYIAVGDAKNWRRTVAATTLAEQHALSTPR